MPQGACSEGIGLANMVIKNDGLLDARDTDLLKMKYGYLSDKIDEATALIEKQLNLLRDNGRLICEINMALGIVKEKNGSSGG